MTRLRWILPVILCATALTWGCNRPTPSAANSNATKTLESRVEKLEQEVKSLVAVRNDLQTKLAESESKLKLEQGRLAAALKERDELKLEIKSRVAERDASQAQYEAFRKSIRELLGHADSAAAKPMPASNPTDSVSVSVPPVGGL